MHFSKQINELIYKKGDNYKQKWEDETSPVYKKKENKTKANAKRKYIIWNDALYLCKSYGVVF